MESSTVYSICIPNYNMADTIERALISVLEQVDDRFEVLVLDDGSSDNSLSILRKLEKTYQHLRVIALPRDSKRLLGETRNITVKEANGEYVILHVDADDVWEPFIKDFVTLFHRLEPLIGHDFLLSGQQINIARRSFLLQHGPYRNTHRAQDRDMWIRLAAIGAYIPMDHRIFRKRLSRPPRTQTLKAIRDTWFTIQYDFRCGAPLHKYLLQKFLALFYDPKSNASLKLRVFRMLSAIPAYIVSRRKAPLPPPENMSSYAKFAAYRDGTGGTWPDLMKRYGGDPDLSFLSPEARDVFAHGRNYRGTPSTDGDISSTNNQGIS